MERKEPPAGTRASMEPAGVSVRYRYESGGEGVLAVQSFADCENDECALEVAFDGEVVEVRIVPKVPLELARIQVKLRHAFASNEMVLLNGYQSWTDTAEHLAWSRMRGLRSMLSAPIARHSLDGDYAVADYSARCGEQHGFTYATFRRGEGTVLVASLDDTRGFTLIRTSAASGEVTLEPESPARMLDAGERFTLGRIAVVRGAADQCYDRWFELSGVHARPAKPIVGYTSWYCHYDDIDEEKLTRDLDGAVLFYEGQLFRGGWQAELAEKLPQYAVKLFQIDDGYSKVGDWLAVDKKAFPRGLAFMAERIRKAGFLPGLWVAPFVCERDSRLFTEHNDWLLRDEAGDPVPVGYQWSGSFALDTRNVEVRSYVLEVLQTMVQEWGFGLIKADFLFAACMHPHDGMNRGELMADAIDLLRKGVGDDTLILGCGVPLASAFGKVEYCRIGCDVGSGWSGMPHVRPLCRERVSTKNSLANTYGRAPLDGRAFGNDPDVIFLRKGACLSSSKRDELLFADADLGSVLLASEDMGAWADPPRDRYREALSLLMSRGRWTSRELGTSREPWASDSL